MHNTHACTHAHMRVHTGGYYGELLPSSEWKMHQDVCVLASFFSCQQRVFGDDARVQSLHLSSPDKPADRQLEAHIATARPSLAYLQIPCHNEVVAVDGGMMVHVMWSMQLIFTSLTQWLSQW
jgi:hypothetical protein